MSSQEYLESLGMALSTLVPAKERMNILRYYKEYFEEAGPENEPAIMEELGDPVELARKIAREGGFSGREADAEKSGKKSRNWVVIGIVAVLAAGLLLVVILLAFNLSRLGKTVLPGGEAASPNVTGGQQNVSPQISPELGQSVASQPQNTPALSGEEPDNTSAEQYTEIDVEIGVGNITLETGEAFDLRLECAGPDAYGED